ncbi:MAG: DUF2946 domain-containing protein [Variovorax sp.]|nr:MAG: DUF2946 domain-containing protein [Variovorax sp.]
MPTFLRHAHSLALLGRIVLAWFVLSLGVAVASPVVKPQAMELVCSTAGAVKVIVQTDDGAQEVGSSSPMSHMDCPLCVLTGAPPPATPLADVPAVQPLGRAVQPIPAARLAAATAAPLPARGPPALS